MTSSMPASSKQSTALTDDLLINILFPDEPPISPPSLKGSTLGSPRCDWSRSLALLQKRCLLVG